MSHFSVLVMASDEEDVRAKLLPYHEFGWGEDVPFESERPYLEFVEDAESEPDPDVGTRGYWCNPNAKWDWYVIGGRQANRVVEGDTALIGELDVPRLREQKRRKAEADWREFVGTFGRLYAAGVFALGVVMPMMRLLKRDPRKAWGWLDRVKSSAADGKHAYLDFKVEAGDWRGLYVERESGGLTWALVTPEGEWLERGDMGWFGMYSDYDPKYDARFWYELGRADPGQRVYVVDCHI